MSRKKFEEWYPRVLGASCFIALLYYNPTSLSATGKDAASAVLVMGSIFCGFLATAFSILYSSADSKKVSTLRTSGAFKEIIEYLWESMIWNLAAIFIALLSIFFPYELAGFSRYINMLMFSIGCCAFFAMFRITKLYVKVLLL